MYTGILNAGTNAVGSFMGGGGFGGGGGAGKFGANSMQSQLGYQNAGFNPNSGTFDVNF